MPFIDFQEVKSRVSIEDAAQKLGLKLTKSGVQLRGECVACGQGGPRGLAITPSKNLFYCFSAQKGGDQLALVAHAKGFGTLEQPDIRKAAEWLGGTSTVKGTSDDSTVQVRKNRANDPPAPTSGFPPLDYLDAEHPAVEAAGFNQTDARALGIGYAPKGIMRGTVAVPIRNEEGTLLGYIGVTEAKCPPKGLLPQTNVVPLKQRA
jgi:DNA primase